MKRKIAQAAILLCLIALPLLAVSYLGYNTVGGTMGSVGGAILTAGGPYTAPSDGTATRLELYTDSVVNDCTLAVYSDNGSNYPNVILKQSAGGALNGGSGTDDWRGQDLTSSLSITSGTKYWLVWECGTNTQDVFYDAFGGHGQFINNSYASGALATPFPGSAAPFNIDFSIRLVYTPSGGGGASKALSTLGAGE